MNDEGTGGGSAFDGVDARYGIGVESVGSESVHGFGGEGYQASGAEKAGSVGDFAGVGGWGHS